MDSKSKKLVSLFVASMLVIPSVGCTPQEDDDEDENNSSSSGYRGGHYIGGSGRNGPDKDANYKRGIGLKSGGSAG